MFVLPRGPSKIYTDFTLCAMFCNDCGLCITIFSQGLGNVYRSGNLGTYRSVACFPAFGVAPSMTGILGVRYAYQPKQKQQQKRNEVPSYRIGVTKSQDSLHTGFVK